MFLVLHCILIRVHYSRVLGRRWSTMMQLQLAAVLCMPKRAILHMSFQARHTKTFAGFHPPGFTRSQALQLALLRRVRLSCALISGPQTPLL